MTQPETATFAEFARLAGFKAPYVTQLKRDGRLVLTDDGKRVCVAESLARIAETRDPSKAAVAARHAEARGAAVPTAPAGGMPHDADDDDADPDDGEIRGTGWAHWRARTERAKALAAERDNAVAEGKLLDAAQVESAVASAVTQLRNQLEQMADILAPELAPLTDEAQVRAKLHDHLEHTLAELARAFDAMAKREAA
ncbi:MAG TPA: hypothetical protein VF216_12250 [Mizugakiibacter sp.]